MKNKRTFLPSAKTLSYKIMKTSNHENTIFQLKIIHAFIMHKKYNKTIKNIMRQQKYIIKKLNKGYNLKIKMRN